MPERRGTYFAFQGLFMAVLLLIFLYQYRGFEGWVERFFLIVAVLAASLALIRWVPAQTLSRGVFQTALFVGDAALASLILHWAQPQSDLYLLYFIVIFGTALTRSWTQSLVVALLASLLYLVSGWSPGAGFPSETGFWLRVHLLWVSSALMAVLARDTRTLKGEQERRYLEHTMQMERLAALGQVAGEVAHRIKGPLTTILVNTEVLTRKASLAPDMQRQVDRIHEEAGRCKEILKGLLNLGRIEEIYFASIDLRDAVRSALKAVEPRLQKSRVRLQARGLERSARVLGDQSLLHEAVAALLHNALDALPESGGTVTLSLHDSEADPWWLRLWSRPHYDVEVEDDGKGIESKDIERIFQPFYTTKREGSGMGLPAALRILQKHEGTLSAHSDGPGRGARFVLSLPKAEKPRARRLQG